MVMNSRRQIAVIAPEKMAKAFAVLINSIPNQSLLASAFNLDELVSLLGEKKPDVLLVYFVQENEPKNGKPAYETIVQMKNIWPDALCVTIVKYASQLEQAKENGADLALIDGVNAEKLLAAIEGELT